MNARTSATKASIKNRFAAGRKRTSKSTSARTVRDMIRKHVADHNLWLGDLSIPWKCKPASVRSIMCTRRAATGRPLPSQFIDALVEFLKLDDFDRTALHRQAAREAGYAIDGPTVEDETW